MKDKDNREDWDNGMTVAPMDNVPQSPFLKNIDKKTRKRAGGEEYTKEEKKAMIGGMFLAMLPRILCILTGFGLVILLVVLWLS